MGQRQLAYDVVGGSSGEGVANPAEEAAGREQLEPARPVGHRGPEGVPGVGDSLARARRHGPAEVRPDRAASCPIRGAQTATQSSSLLISRLSSGDATTAPTR